MKTMNRIFIAIVLCLFLWETPTERAEYGDPNLIYAPDPVVPQVAIRKGWGGRGVYHLKINPSNGTVEEVKVLKRVGYPVLDAEMVMTLFKWRFKPHTITSFTIPCEIGIYGRSRDYHTGRYR